MDHRKCKRCGFYLDAGDVCDCDVQSVQTYALLAEKFTTEDCATCKNRHTDCYKFYTYPCSECKHRARDSYEKEEGAES